MHIDFMEGFEMRCLKAILVFCVLTLTLAGCTASTVGTGPTLGTTSYFGAGATLGTTSTVRTGATLGNGNFPADGNYGPATSSPQVYITPNGDRVGHYAPYFYPDGTGGGERP